jgi:hypothetical protein
MNAFAGRLPVRPHLRPKPRRSIFADPDPEFVLADVWEGEGRPTRGWDGWRQDFIPLADALALPVGGEA